MKIKLKPNFGKKSIIFSVLAAVLLFADLITKYLEEKYIWNVKIIPGVVEFIGGEQHRNPGIAFGLFADNPQVGQPIFIAFTSVLTVALILAFIFLPERFTLLKLACSLIIAGAIGNLVDRIMLFEVRDWFLLWIFGICNLADFWVVIGAVLAIVDLAFLNEWAVFPLTKKAKEAQKAAKSEEDKDDGKD